MKKLMFAAVAVACGTAMAIESDIVGYAQSELDNDYGAVLVSAQFSSVSDSTGKIDLGSIKPTASGDVDMVDAIEIQFLNTDGTTDYENDYFWDGVKWYNGSTYESANNVMIEPGQGLWVLNTTGEAVGFQSAGKVSTTDVNVDLDNDYGAVAAGNPFPVALTLGDIVPLADDVDMVDAIEIQFLNTDGTTDYENDYFWDGAKWYDGSTYADATSVSIPAGKGLWVLNTTGENVSLRFAAPEL